MSAAKRLMDVTIAGGALMALAPLLAVTAVAIRMTLGSPVLFRQVRPGLGGWPFELVKFRTMRDAAGPSGEPLPAEVRLTSLGHLLRQCSIDELPQLWNVLRGDMSLVGPRPLLMQYLELYSPEQARRHDVKPGITGWAQVNGRNAVSWEKKFELDVWYVENRSCWLDVKILLLTLGRVLRRDGINQEGRATVDAFRGNSG
jgi:lipopolysaccharide/colanic/teichoic acid biosynthesis glycosyltransferase